VQGTEGTRRSSGLLGSNYERVPLPAIIHDTEYLFSNSEPESDSESGSEEDSEVEITDDEPENTDLNDDAFQRMMTRGTIA